MRRKRSAGFGVAIEAGGGDGVESRTTPKMSNDLRCNFCFGTGQKVEATPRRFGHNYRPTSCVRAVEGAVYRHSGRITVKSSARRWPQQRLRLMQPLKAESWHDPSRGALVFSRRSPELHPVESGGAFFVNGPVPVANQIRTYWWCSPPRIGRQRMSPASSTAREIGASFSKDKCVRISL